MGEKHAFVWAPLLSFLTTCEDRGLKLILDLRNNPGGNSFYPPSLAHYLIEDYSKNRVGNSTYAIRTNFSWMAQAYNSGRAIANAPRVIQGPTAEHMYPVLRQAHEEAYKAGKSKSNIAVVDYPGFDEDEMDEYQGFLYTGDMITLISPYCISACDRMSAILKRTKRSPIYGTATNGTGLGTAVPWYESNGEYYVGIPSYLFGVTDERIKNADEQQVTFDYDIYQEEWLLENRPTDADHQLSITLDDLRAGDYLGSYRKTVVNALIADDVTKLKN